MQENTGKLPKDALFLMLAKQHIIVDPLKLNAFLKFAHFLEDNSIQYDQFIDLLNILRPYPLLDKISDIPEAHLRYQTTYHALAADCQRPFVKNELPKPFVHECDRSDMGALLNPGVCIRNGIWHEDYLRGRSKSVIRDIFKAANYKIDDDEFDSYWLECCCLQDNSNGLVSVESFKTFLDNKI